MNKLFIPGPVNVSPEILKEMARDQISHRSDEFREIFSKLKRGLRNLFFTQNDVLVSTSSGSGFWEASVNSCVNKKVLHAVNGSFSKKWAEVSERCGKETKIISFQPGTPVDCDTIKKELQSEEYEAFCMVHNETSTGVASDLEKMSQVMKLFPNVLWFVDAVSSLGAMKIEVDLLGIDICFTSSQKALGLPPGISLASVSEKAYKKAEGVSFRGYYFDILELKKSYDKEQTPYTPSIPHIYALGKQLERIQEETLEKRFQRHKEIAESVRSWAKKNSLDLFSQKGFHSDTVSCIVNSKDLDFKSIKKEMAQKGFVIDSGYTKLNEKLIEEGKKTTFRIAHMGEIKHEQMKEYLEELEKYLA